MARFVEDGEVAGVVTLVATRDRVIHFHIAGWSDLTARKPIKYDSIFAIASMTKPVAATAVMMLQDEGRLSVEDKVAEYLPEFADLKTPHGEKANLTIRHLLTHTSGMHDVAREVRNRCATLEELVPHWVSRPVKFEPGSRWMYCQAAINAAARVVEVVSGQSFPEFLSRRVFEPLGMNDTTFYLSEGQMPRLAKAYRRPDGGALEEGALRLLGGKSPTSRNRHPMASGGLFSTAGDYARFCQMVLNDGELNSVRCLSRETVELMTTLQTGGMKAGFTPGSGWGLGWSVVREPQDVTAPLSAGAFGHGGAYGTQAWIDPVAKRVYLLMVQRLDWPNSDRSEVKREFLRLAKQAEG